MATQGPQRLSKAMVANPPENVRVNEQPAEQPKIGIVHLGWGGFARAHIGTIIDDLPRGAKQEWGISAVSMRSPTIRDQMEPQGNLYTVSERHADGDRTRIIDAVKETLVTPENPQRVIDRMAAPETKIVSMTVTQQGYCRDDKTGALDPNAPAIKGELDGSAPVTSMPGMIVAAIEKRRAAGLQPFTVMSLDNIPDNGHATKQVVVDYAKAKDPALAAYIEQKVKFPNSMVDRITPSPKPSEIDELAARTGIRDEAAVFTEPFRQLVIEDSFGPLGRPPLHDVAGVKVTPDVRPFEAAKIKMLNGAHMMMGTLGRAAGFRTVDQCMADPDMGPFVKRFMSEVAATIDPIPGTNMQVYGNDLAERFNNPRMGDDVDRLANDTSKKIHPRLLEALTASMQKGTPNDALSVALAGWQRFMQATPGKDGGPEVGLTDTGRLYAITDPTRSELTAIANTSGSQPDQLLAAVNFKFEDHGQAGKDARRKVISALDTMKQDSALSAIRSVSMRLDDLPKPVVPEADHGAVPPTAPRNEQRPGPR